MVTCCTMFLAMNYRNYINGVFIQGVLDFTPFACSRSQYCTSVNHFAEVQETSKYIILGAVSNMFLYVPPTWGNDPI